MGLDLHAVEPIPSWQANWTGWTMLGDLLGELVGDVAAMTDTAGGQFVDGPTALDWGAALHAALDDGAIGYFDDPGGRCRWGLWDHQAGGSGKAERLDDEDIDYLRSVVGFMTRSGGFHQFDGG